MPPLSPPPRSAPCPTAALPRRRGTLRSGPWWPRRPEIFAPSLLQSKVATPILSGDAIPGRERDMSFILFLFLAYWMPTIIALVRHTPSALGIAAVNFL